MCGENAILEVSCASFEFHKVLFGWPCKTFCSWHIAVFVLSSVMRYGGVGYARVGETGWGWHFLLLSVSLIFSSDLFVVFVWSQQHSALDKSCGTKDSISILILTQKGDLQFFVKQPEFLDVWAKQNTVFLRAPCTGTTCAMRWLFLVFGAHDLWWKTMETSSSTDWHFAFHACWRSEVERACKRIYHSMQDWDMELFFLFVSSTARKFWSPLNQVFFFC